MTGPEWVYWCSSCLLLQDPPSGDLQRLTEFLQYLTEVIFQLSNNLTAVETGVDVAGIQSKQNANLSQFVLGAATDAHLSSSPEWVGEQTHPVKQTAAGEKKKKRMHKQRTGNSEQYSSHGHHGGAEQQIAACRTGVSRNTKVLSCLWSVQQQAG